MRFDDRSHSCKPEPGAILSGREERFEYPIMEICGNSGTSVREGDVHDSFWTVQPYRKLEIRFFATRLYCVVGYILQGAFERFAVSSYER